MAIGSDLLNMLGSLGNIGGGDALSALSLLSMLGGKGGMGDLSGILNMMNGFSAAPEAKAGEEPPVEVGRETSAYFSSCDRCPLQCDRAGLGLPPFEEVRQMAAHWQRW